MKQRGSHTGDAFLAFSTASLPLAERAASVSASRLSAPSRSPHRLLSTLLKVQQNKPPAPCSVLFWPVLEHPQNRRVLSVLPPLTFFREAGDGEAAEGRGRLPPAWFPSGACATARGGPRKKSRKYQRSRLQQNICSARRSEPRDLWPNAQPAPRLHRRTSFCLREQAVSTLYVPKLGSALCSTPAASWLPRSRTRPSRQRRCICSTY